MEDNVVLLDCWASSFGMRVRLALALKGIKYEYKEENLEDKSRLLVEMNPVHKKIPVLIHNGNPICESLIIVEYIDEVWHDDFPLLPSDAHQRSLARFWAAYADKLYGISKRLWMGKGEEQEKAKNELIECLKTLEGELGEKAYMGGEKIGFVDVALLPFSRWFYSLEKCANFTIKDECPKLVGWVDRCMEMEIVSNSLPHPHKIYGFVLNLKEKLGIA
ncbi:PREDICTED: probable glutathione S-transferase parA [Ipomoea nil]|uniref:probable glutathione S-transferase parA n=1 Tax=Ipomoea nil TaxID=35883 RepID=UPI000900B900|nr:PREDICTED: probable glutathione S-transferase parA [Ipomoea nil]XP_019189627.1 PREDICTED: probable glutathione S-transferase parA [Ipomoea nil]